MKRNTTQNKTTLLLIVYTCNTLKSKGDNIVFVYNVVYCKIYAYMNRASIGVKVPSTSSLSVYTKVLAHNLNDIRNWASLTGLLLRICWCLLSVFLIYCSDEWKSW